MFNNHNQLKSLANKKNSNENSFSQFQFFPGVYHARPFFALSARLKRTLILSDAELKT